MAETLRIEIPIETIDDTEPELSNLIKKLGKLGAEADKTGQKVKKSSEHVSEFDKRAQKTEKSLAKWAKEKYEIVLEAKEKITPVLSRIGSGLRGFAGKTWSITMRAIDFVTSPVQGIINLLKNPIFQVGAVLGVSIGLKDTIDTYKDFEAAMSQVQAVSGATEAEVTKLTNKAKEMGATTKFTAEESAQAFNYMAMAGWKTGDMLEGIEGILSLAAASGEELSTTSDIVTDALTAFRMQASDAGHFADVMAAATSNANTTVSGMGETFKYAATMAGTLGYSIEDVALAAGLMANSSIKGSMAGTALNSIFTRLSTNTGKARDALEEIGIGFFNSDGSARDLSDVLEELRTATASYSDQQKSELANTIAGTEAQKGLLAILNASTEDYSKLAEAVNNADGASKRMSDTMLDNLQGSLTLLQSAVDGVKIAFGERLSPYVRGIAEWLNGQMPAVEDGLDRLMDMVDKKVSRMKSKFEEISGTREWQEAGLFGKMKIAWDKFIAEPFSEWWSSTGKVKFAGFAQDIGEGIGAGLKFGIMTLLGIDLGETVDGGISIGASFARGFSEGFDFKAVSDGLWQGFKNLLSNAGKLLPGGESADLSSVLSAALLAKMAGPMISAGSSIFKIGSLSGKLLGSFSVADELAGTGLAGGSGLLGLLGNTGIALGSGATTSVGQVAAGGGAIAGALAAGATLVSAGGDAYHVFQSDDKEEQRVYAESASLKASGVAAGAIAGAAFGSVIPGLGTAIGALIGAGLGGLAGWARGDKVKEEYEGNLEAAQKAAEKAQKFFEATGLSLNEVTFETEALNSALNDTEVSAEELGAMFQEAVSDKLISKFGDIHLSLKEIKETAAKITFDKQADSLTKFSEASQTSTNALASLQNYMRTIDKMNWKAGLGMELNENDKEGYKSAMDELAAQAKTYLEDKHYEASAALELLIGNNNEEEMSGSLNGVYEGLQAQIDEKNKELSEKIEIYLEDGVITLDEQKELVNLQNQIADITSKVTQAQEDAKFEAMKIKYGGTALDAESFASLQEELAVNVQSMTEGYDNALEVSLTNLRLQLSEGAIDQSQYDEMLKEVTDGYNAQIDELQVRVESFQLDTIAETFGSELDGILPDIEGTASEKLKEAMNQALSVKPDPASWTVEEISEWFNLEGLSGEVQVALGTMLQKTAETIPESIAQSLHESMKASMSGEALAAEGMQMFGFHELTPIMETELTGAIENVDYGAAGMAAMTGIGAALSSAAMDQINEGIETIYGKTGTQIDTTFSNTFTTTADVDVKFNLRYLNPDGGIGLNTGKSSTMTLGGISSHASGGFVNGPQLSWLAEEGYGEFVIPTNPSRRSRALELYEQAGQMLGVEAYADGGFVGNDDGAVSPVSSSPAGNSWGVGDTPQIKISVQMSPQFTIQGGGEQSEETIVQVLKRHMKEIADEFGGEIAASLEEVFSNMPVKEG
ncbi:MAG: phage tail tape measure protein [Lachnospiraceae bacterium]|nr:phage tail tape measure protein [Lachnospiraceae bacterium]